MPYAVLEQKINALPEAYFGEISDFLDFLAFKVRSAQTKTDKKPRIGVAKGKFSVPEEFDEWDKEIADSFGDDL